MISRAPYFIGITIFHLICISSDTIFGIERFKSLEAILEVSLNLPILIGVVIPEFAVSVNSGIPKLAIVSIIVNLESPLSCINNLLRLNLLHKLWLLIDILLLIALTYPSGLNFVSFFEVWVLLQAFQYNAHLGVRNEFRHNA